MIWSKRPQPQCPEQADPFEDKVKCTTCKHYIDKLDAQEVKVSGRWHEKRFYCEMHKVPYEEIWISHLDMATYYYKKFSVDEKGVPAGYKKIKNA
jgi:hypothetical protein